MTEFISPFEFFEEFRNNFDKILMEENGSIKYNLKIGHFQRMKTIITTKYPASLESVMETKKILEQRVNELIEMLPETMKNRKWKKTKYRVKAHFWSNIHENRHDKTNSK